MYWCLDAALLRATALPVDAFVASPTITGDDATDADRWREWTRRVFAKRQFSEAVGLASPELAARVARILTGEETRPEPIVRVGAAVYRYLLRAVHRATPFGLFAGIAPAQQGADLSVRVGPDHRAVTRDTPENLARQIIEAHHDPAVLARVLVIANNTAQHRDDRLVLPFPQHVLHPPGGQDAEGRRGARCAPAVSIRHTPLVREAMMLARTPIRFTDLTARLAPADPDAESDQQARRVTGVLAALVRCGFLVSSLQPPMTASDPQEWIDRHLHTGPASSSAPDDARPVEENCGQAHDDGVLPDVGVDVAVVADLRLDGELVLPPVVLREAERAAALLTRLSVTPHAPGRGPWARYRDRFTRRYGRGTLVPLQVLLDPGRGLGYPDGFRGGPPAPAAGPVLTARDPGAAGAGRAGRPPR